MPIMRNGEFFGKRTRMSHEESRSRRFSVYDYIKAHTGKKITNLDLARAAGYSCDLKSNEREYKRGLGFIDNMIRLGYISYTDHPGMGRLWYISGKDKDYDVSLRTEVISLPETTEELRAMPVPDDALIVKEPTEEPSVELAEDKFTFDCVVSLKVDEDHRLKFDLKGTDLDSLLSKIKSAVEVIR